LEPVQVAGELVTLGVGHTAAGAGGDIGRVRCAEEDRDLDLVVPVALESVDLPLGEQTAAQEEQRHHRDEHHRHKHGGVAAQPVADLAEQEAQPHTSPSSTASYSPSAWSRTRTPSRSWTTRLRNRLT